MSDKDQELSLDDLGDLELGAEDAPKNVPVEEDGLELSFEESEDLDLGSAHDSPIHEPVDSGMDLDLDEGFSLDEFHEESSSLAVTKAPDTEALDFDLTDDGEETPDLPELGDELSLSDDSDDLGLDLGGDDFEELSLDSEKTESKIVSLDLSGDDSDDVGFDLGGDDAVDLSDSALEKLKQIDAIMDYDASQVEISMHLGLDSNFEKSDNEADSDIDTSLVSDDLDLGSINFSSEEVSEPEEKPKKKATKDAREPAPAYEGNLNKDLKDISHAYSGEMERMQATVSNLRTDRTELLAKIQKLEEDRTIQNRQTLTMRAELDEKKIELSIIRKKLNDEITDLKDRLKLYEEKKLILEEKYKILLVDLDKVAQKNRIDVKKVQMRERELEQKLELLKADSETQIRHRDLKILELKRKLDAMEFDIESISVQEKRSVESRFELEDKLGKAIKTLRNAITVLEDESEKSSVLDALKKNIDM